jgi:serine/threonine protein kinase
MLRYDPSKRPTASECLQHPFFKVKIPIPVNAPTITSEEDVDKILDEVDVLSLSRKPSEFQRDFEKKQRQAILKHETGLGTTDGNRTRI